MSSPLRTLRSRALTPKVSATRLGVRGFHVKDDATREVLETVGSTFLTGYAAATAARDPAEAEEQLDRIAPRFRGFAYEGAAMGFAILDALSPRRHDRVTRFLAGHGDAHAYMVHVGVGWAMARMPQLRWRVLTVGDPLLRWLALDGYGFHQAYFHTDRYVRDQHQDTHLRWPAGATPRQRGRVLDQGIGRAMWFVGGADPDVVADLVDRFAPDRRCDLYSGAGLAATYAGGCTPEELRRFAERAGEHLPYVAQAAAFAAEARVRAGITVPHTELATRTFCGTSPADAARLTRRLRPDSPEATDPSLYQEWRRRVSAEFATARKGATA